MKRFFWLQNLKQARQKSRRFRQQMQTLEPRLLLTTFVVDSTNDSIDANPGDGIAADASGDVTLRAAIHEANSLAGPDVIELPAGTYELSLSGVGEDDGLTGDLDFTDDVTLQGNAAGDTIIDANDLDRVFEILAGVNVTIQNVTIQDATNLSSAGDGGAIRNHGTLLIEESLIKDSDSAGGGGAIVNESTGDLNLRRSRIEQSAAVGTRGGGALLNRGVATIDNSVLRQNTSQAGGGAIFNSGNGATLTITDSEFNGNTATNGQDGGAILNQQMIDIERSLFVANQATNGGAIANDGLGVSGGMIVNTTFSGNSVAANGGALFVDTSESMGILDSTFTANQAGQSGGAIRNLGSVTIGGTIVAENTAMQVGNDIHGGISSIDYNLIGDSVGSGPYADHDLLDVAPGLEPLADNGGPTMTHALSPGSRAIDANEVPARPVDQRGGKRPVDANNDGIAEGDIGAYEVQNFQFTPPSALKMTLILNGDNVELLNTVTAELLKSELFDPAGATLIDGSGGDDELTIDFAGGNPIPDNGVTFNALGQGQDGDGLKLKQMGFDSAAYNFATIDNGQIDLELGGAMSTVTFVGLESGEDLLNAVNRSFTYQLNSDIITITDGAAADDDQSQIASSTTSPTFDFRNPTGSMTVNSGAGNDLVTIASIDGLFEASLIINGEDDNDTLDATNLDLAVTLDGASGNDVLTGGNLADYLFGSGGADALAAGNGDDTLLGGSQRDRLDGGEGNDILLGQGATKDTLTGGLGNDLINGGGGDVLLEFGDADLTLTDSSLTGVGADALSGIAIATLVGGASNNTIDATGFSGYTALLGLDGDDTISGGPAPNVLVGGFGDDDLFGNDGNDTLLGSGGRDRLDGGPGSDRLRGQGASNDTLIASTGDDTLDGGPGGDVLFATADADLTLTTGLLTGLGNDVLISVERARLVGGISNNTLDASGFAGRVDVYGLEGDDVLIGAAGFDILAGGDGNDTLKGRDGNDSLFGQAGDDILNGGVGDDELDGGDGNDGLSGWLGNDVLIGDDGNDTGYGGAGNDVLFGGANSDVLQGGEGDDDLQGNGGINLLTGGIGNGTAEPGDSFDDPSSVDEFFNLDPLPDWIDQI